MQQTPLLTPEQEKELFQRMAFEKQMGGSAARDHLIRANLRLVPPIARKFVDLSKPPLQDLIQMGNLGLISAVDHFDLSRNNRFSTYATWAIRNRIKQELVQRSYHIRIPEHIITLCNKYRRTMKELEKQWQRTPTFDEVCTSLKISQKLRSRMQSAFAIFESSTSSIQELNHLEISDEARRDNAREQEIFDERLQEAYAVVDEALTPRERYIICMRLGLCGEKERTLVEVGSALGSITKERVRQLQNRALEKLRAAWEEALKSTS